MSELRECPFCCGEVDNHKDDCYFRLYSVAFVDSLMLGKSGMNVHVSSRELFDAWNTRAERTCENMAEQCFREAYNAFLCSRCGTKTAFTNVDYCPSCGAKVVSE